MTMSEEEGVSNLVRLRELSHYLSQLEPALAIFGQLTQAVWIIANHGVFIGLNQNWQRTLGYTVEEGLDKNYKTFVHPDDSTSTVAAEVQLWEGKLVSSFVNRYLHKDNHWVYIEWWSFQDPVSKLVYGVGHDVTYKVKLDKVMAHINADPNKYKELLELV